MYNANILWRLIISRLKPGFSAINELQKKLCLAISDKIDGKDRKFRYYYLVRQFDKIISGLLNDENERNEIDTGERIVPEDEWEAKMTTLETISTIWPEIDDELVFILCPKRKDIIDEFGKLKSHQNRREYVEVFCAMLKTYAHFFKDHSVHDIDFSDGSIGLLEIKRQLEDQVDRPPEGLIKFRSFAEQGGPIFGLISAIVCGIAKRKISRIGWEDVSLRL